MRKSKISVFFELAMVSLTLCLMPALIPLSASAQVSREANCFRKEDNRNLRFDHVMQSQGIQPDANGIFPADSPAYPLTSFYYNHGKLPNISGGNDPELQLDQYALHWINRCSHLKELNGTRITPDQESCRNPGSGASNVGVGQVPVNQFLSGPFNFTPDMPIDLIRARAIYPLFSTYKKADTCSMTQALSLYGAPMAFLKRFVQARGVALKLWYRDSKAGERESDVDRLVSTARVVRIGFKKGPFEEERIKAIVDVCLLASQPIPETNTSNNGLALDYEVFDYREPAEALQLIRGMRGILARFGKKLLLTSDPMGGHGTHAPTSANPHGIGPENAFAILNSVDYWALHYTNGAGPQIGSHQSTDPKVDLWTNYQNLLKVLTNFGQHDLDANGGALRRKMLMSFSIYDTTLDEARRFHHEFRTKQYGGLRIAGGWVKGGRCDRTEIVERSPGYCQRTFGTSSCPVTVPVNQVIACMTMGQCSGTFGSNR